jgi:hypothetical protein
MLRLVSQAVLLLILSATFCSAQEARGTILGRVTDSSGAVIPGTAVSIANVSTGVASKVDTNEQGNYLVPYLSPGKYRVTAEKTGFHRFQRDAVELRVNDRLELNFSLQVGALEETITVVAESPILDTSSASMGQVVDSRRLAELPMPHGNPYMLVSLTPGAAWGSNSGSYVSNEPYHFYGAPYSMSGVKSFHSDYSVDGTPATHRYNANMLIAAETPMTDMVAEVKVQTAIFDATVGQTEGGIINFSMKSGTNSLHGTAYWVKMAPEMTANLFFANRASQPRTDFTYNRWGVTAGGPVTIPKLYNGKNRTFFIYGYEGLRNQKPRGGVLTVPTEAERGGNFSALLAVGSRYQIYDPATRRPAAGGRIQSDPFPGNIIPTARISPIAKKILNYFPLPEAAGTADGTNNLPRPNEPASNWYHNHTLRVDHNTSTRNRAYGRFNESRELAGQFDYFKNGTNGELLVLHGASGTFDDVFTFGPSFVVNARAGYLRYLRGRADEMASLSKFDLTSLGFPSYYNDLIPPAKRFFPRIQPAGYTSLGKTFDFGPRDVISLATAFDKVSGNHNLKFGLDYRAYRNNFYNYSATTGTFVFSTDWTKGPLDNSTAAPIGQGLAGMLLGLPTSGYVDRDANYAEQSTAWSLYFQDSWKLTRKLTVTLGLRYELEGPLTERFNRSVRGFDAEAALPIETQVRANYAANPTPEIAAAQYRVRGGMNFAGVGGNPRTLWSRDTNNFMPRLGAAYSATSKTVIRAGYGVTYGFLGVRRGDVIQNGFSQRTQMVPTQDNGLTFMETLANPFPKGVQEPFGASLGAMTDVGKSISFFNPSPKAPRMQKWQLGIQRELPQRVLVEIAYVGNRGSDIEVGRNWNTTPLQYLSTAPVRDQPRIDYLTANLPNPFYPLLPGTDRAATVASRVSLINAYPQFSTLSTTTNEGRSWYRALQARVERRFAQGYTIQAAYTWSKFTDAVELLNGADPAPTKVVSSEDYPHRIAVSGIYELPFGRDRKWLNAAPSAAGVLLSGWQVEGVFVWQSYSTLGFGNSIFTGNLGGIPLPSSRQTPERWVNIDAGFERDSAKQLQYNVRTFPLRFANVRSDAINNWDLSVIKNTRIREGIRLEFRGEFINAFNHVTFSAPNTSPTSTAFGQVTSELSFARQVQLGIKLIY